MSLFFLRESSNRIAILRYTVGVSKILSLLPFPAARNPFSIKLIKKTCLPFKSLLRAHFDFYPKIQRPSTPLLSEIQRKTQQNTSSQRPVFRPKIIPFLCSENAPRKCKWLQCVRLVINKRRPSPDVAANAATSPSRFAISRNP